MGTMITLGIDKMEIDWGKNNIFTNHSKLFQRENRKLIPYYYGNEDDPDRIDVTKKYGYSTVLSSIKNRLDLLDYTMDSVEKKYNSLLDELSIHSIHVRIPFKAFNEVIYNIDIKKANTLEWEKENFQNGYDFGEYARLCLMKDPEIKKIAKLQVNSSSDFGYDLEAYLENMDPYILLRILAENPLNSDAELQWRYTDIIESGWEKEEKIFEPLPPEEKILIVTEGSSDSFILKRSIDFLYPDISDFFEFVDMEDNYPFTGVGNLYNFFLGLVRIKVQNKVIIIFDNDVAGNEKYNLASEIDKPSNIKVTKLPYDSDFENIETIGPSGISFENINGSAVAIECFLDFSSIDGKPSIRWTTYSKKAKKYQGELVSKDRYVRAFKKADLTNSNYDVKKIRKLIDFLIIIWISQ